MKYLEEIKSLALPAGEYVIFGSAPLAVRGLRDNDDLDVLATPELVDQLLEMYPVGKNSAGQPTIKIGHIELWKTWPPFNNPREVIENPDMIEGLPFAKLKYVLEWKRFLDREKDQRDVALIEDYLKHGGPISTGNKVGPY